MNIKEKNIIRKLSFLISYSRYKHCSLDLLINKLDQLNLNLQELKICFFFPSPFAIYGDYERFEKIHNYLKNRIDTFLNRKAEFIGISLSDSYRTYVSFCIFIESY